MAFEVEQKFAITDRASLERKLTDLGATLDETVIQSDRYFAHPGRDFARSDEALRLRQVGELNFVTYKGPKLDSTTKTRREIEISLAPGSQTALDAGELLTSLGFSLAGQVCKRRLHFTLVWQDRKVSVDVDEVERLGTFVELEIVTEEAELDRARELLASLARQLDLANSERRSYLELLLAKTEAG